MSVEYVVRVKELIPLDYLIEAEIILDRLLDAFVKKTRTD